MSMENRHSTGPRSLAAIGLFVLVQAGCGGAQQPAAPVSSSKPTPVPLMNSHSDQVIDTPKPPSPHGDLGWTAPAGWTIHYVSGTA